MAGVLRRSLKSPKLSKELKAFCKRLGITRYVPVALRIIEESFPTAGKLKMYPDGDLETGEEWLAVEVTVRGELAEVQRQYDRYTDKKIALIPWRQGEAIRLLHRYESA